ncbi:MAG: Holliday junction branch migration protein RuvA [Terriglobales bacterium]
MIAHLRGRLLSRHPAAVVIEAAGVGYELQVTVATYGRLPEPGADVALHVHTQVREDAIQLFGFATAAEKLLFETLIGVNGVGPKLALAILSGLPPAELAAALRGADYARLTSIPGIGKKTAERLVFELRDKLAAGEAAAAMPVLAPGPAEDVASALVNLGYPAALAQKAVQRMLERTPEADFDALFAACMKTIS